MANQAFKIKMKQSIGIYAYSHYNFRLTLELIIPLVTIIIFK